MEYFYTAIAVEKYDCSSQDMEFLGLYDGFPMAVEQVREHNKKNYVRGLREFDYYIFFSRCNEKNTMKTEDCIYSLTSRMYEEYEEFVKEEYKHLLSYT